MNRAARGSLLNVAGAVVSAVANLALTIIVTRLTAQTDAGVFFSATSLFILAGGVGHLGTNTGLVYFLSGARARGELSRAQAYMRVAAVPVLVVAVAMGLSMFLLAAPLGSALSPGREDAFARYMHVMAFFLPWAALMNVALSGTRGLGTMKVFASVDQVARPLLQLGLVVLALVTTGSSDMAWAWSLAYLPLGLGAWWWWHRLARGVEPQQVKAERIAGPFWRFSAPRALAGITQVAMQRLDIILVGALAGLAPAAIYAAATRFLVLGQSTARAVSLGIQPLLGEALARGDRQEAKAVYQASTAWLVLASWPIYLTLLVFGPTVLEVFGDEYVAGQRALAVLCAAMLLATVCGMVDMVLTMAGRSVWNLTNVLIAFGVNLSVDLVLIPRIGFLGAAIGWATAILVANALPLTQVALSVRLHPFGRATALAVVGTTTAFGGASLVAEALVPNDLWGLVVGVAAGLGLFLPFLYLSRSTLQLPVLLSALRSRRGRRSRG